jgi:hypothetical protein
MAGSARTPLMRDPGNEQRSTFLELFFDLVFALALTRLADGLIDSLKWTDVLETAVLLPAMWWVWTNTVWLTDWLQPDRIPVQAVVVMVMLGSLVLSAAVPGAFDGYGLVFGGIYAAVQVGRRGGRLLLLRAAVAHLLPPRRRAGPGGQPAGPPARPVGSPRRLRAPTHRRRCRRLGRRRPAGARLSRQPHQTGVGRDDRRRPRAVHRRSSCLRIHRRRTHPVDPAGRRDRPGCHRSRDGRVEYGRRRGSGRPHPARCRRGRRGRRMEPASQRRAPSDDADPNGTISRSIRWYRSGRGCCPRPSRWPPR